jgi:hypothetical protein
MIPEEYVINFSNRLDNNFAKRLLIKDQVITIENGCIYSINNQNGELREDNYLGKYFEYTIKSDKLEIPLVLQLYKTDCGFYRLFSYTNKGMLSSFNLSTGYEEGVINIKIQLKLSSRNMTPEDRKINRDTMVSILEDEEIQIISKNTAYLGTYDPVGDNFINTSPKKLLQDFVKLSLIKGHYANNKGYRIVCLEEEG